MSLLSTPPDIDDTKLSILDHLEELRGRLLKSLACIAVLFPLCWYFCGDVLRWFLDFACADLPKVQTLHVMELFFTEMKLSFFMALALAYPFLAFQVWRFVAPGLYLHERRYVSRFVVTSTALFVVGSEIALFYIFPRVVQFGASLASGKIEVAPQLSSVINLAAMLMLGFGVMFQLPIVVYLLAITGLVSVTTMRKARPVIVIVIFTLAAILTPTPDIVTQCALAIPSLFLFEASLIFTDMALRHQRRRREEEERESRAAAAESAPGSPGLLPAAADPPTPVEAVPLPDVTAAVTPPTTPEEAKPVTPVLLGARPESPPLSSAAEPPAGQTSWERWYGNVDAEAAPAAPPAPASPRPVVACEDGGTVGSGQV